ncbi:tetrahydromethanopterin S-methyltransferase subunit C [Methanofollis aquaemaris]|uniref:Tetrahydromethanopterin S-methyltransferase subunit C n=1 Tax=Methanofollis aquaemaris TaxID=126734 RepID=A0A8A3S5U6_9EURY|nr:tetrahydromethanopterin S-methyltransferase subunit C [Methanofollis aquaemaris]QSZ67101.1 tetrahydromethanopterin S-methyltransferase subunit C [Methanofollis aquaemaris]
MTVQITASEGGIPHNTIMAVGLVGSLVCLYLTYANQFLNAEYAAFFGGLAAVFALLWGTDTIKNLCSYGIGTGVPSAGMIAFGTGVIAMLLATKVETIVPFSAPIAAVVFGAIVGAVAGWIANEVMRMNIPVMVRSLTEMAIIGAIVLMGFTAAMAGGFGFDALAAREIAILGPLTTTSYVGSLLGGCLLAVSFMLGSLALQHPFNACLGPGEQQDRTMMLAAECGFLSMIAVAAISFAFIAFPAALLSLIVAIVGWYYTYVRFIELSKRDAFAWLDAKPILEPKGDD